MFRCTIASFQYARQQIVKRVLLLEIAKTRGIRRRDIHGEVTCDFCKCLNTSHIVRDSVARSLVRSNVDTDDPSMRCTRSEASKSLYVTMIVESKPINN